MSDDSELMVAIAEAGGADVQVRTLRAKRGTHGLYLASCHVQRPPEDQHLSHGRRFSEEGSTPTVALRRLLHTVERHTRGLTARSARSGSGEGGR